MDELDSFEKQAEEQAARTTEIWSLERLLEGEGINQDLVKARLSELAGQEKSPVPEAAGPDIQGRPRFDQVINALEQAVAEGVPVASAR